MIVSCCPAVQPSTLYVRVRAERAGTLTILGFIATLECGVRVSNKHRLFIVHAGDFSMRGLYTREATLLLARRLRFQHGILGSIRVIILSRKARVAYARP